MATSLSIILAMQEVYLTWLINNAPVLGLFIFVAWLGWKGRDALAKFQKSIDDRFKSIDDRFKSIEDRLKSLEDRFSAFEKRLCRLENDFQTLIIVLKKKKILKMKYGQRKQTH